MSKKEILKKVTGTQHLKSRYNKKGEIILRDFLALERTTLANERTLFAYLRSGVYMFIAGFAFLELKQFLDLVWLSYFLFFLSLVLFIYGFIRYSILKKKLDVYYTNMEGEYENSKKDKISESE